MPSSATIIPMASPFVARRDSTIIATMRVNRGPMVVMVEASTGFVKEAPAISRYHHPKITSNATMNIEPKSLSESAKKPGLTIASGANTTVEKRSCSAKSCSNDREK